ncbi:hypothetical protein GCM10011425_33270 [Mucilaginibacter galii]|uniref:Uncharacterized protein n=1 Tax=Mucilaginibacter galii TaxID=2005073 RepID=A0A917N2M9_9SPHI|nr:hypothetical protein [Mucilaginibacter galii]GGI52115.1 hypothetical protein GCM10011425_33270 [Mucilaginibacter galii]
MTGINFQRYQLRQVAASQIINQIKYRDVYKLQPFKVEIGYELIIRGSSLKDNYVDRLSIA